MGRHCLSPLVILIVIINWMMMNQCCDAYLLSTANSLLTKLLNLRKQSSNTNQIKSIEIPLYESVSSESNLNSITLNKGEDSNSRSSVSTSTVPLNGFFWSSSYSNNVPQYADLSSSTSSTMPSVEYYERSPNPWSNSLLNNFIADNIPESLLEPLDQWPLNQMEESNYQPKSPTVSGSRSRGIFLYGKAKNLPMKESNSKAIAEQSPMSLNAFNVQPHEMLTMSEDRHYEFKNDPNHYMNRYFDNHKTFYHHQHNYNHPDVQMNDQNHYYNRFYEDKPFDQYEPLQGSFNTIIEHPKKPLNTNWPYKSKYVAENHKQKQESSKVQKNWSIPLNDDKSCKRKSKHNKITSKNQDSTKPNAPNNLKYFESLKKRSAQMDQQITDSSNQHFRRKLPLILVDNLMASNSVNNEQKIRVNNLYKNNEMEDQDDQQRQQQHRQESDDDESGRQNMEIDNQDHSTLYSDDSESEKKEDYIESDDAAEGDGKQYEKERSKWLKDKGYAKHGWKNVYHKEEWGEAKKYHDVWRHKDWKDRYNEKIGASSNVRPVIIIAPKIGTEMNQTTIQRV